MKFQIKIGNLDDRKVVGLLTEHLRDLRALSPPESCHALSINQLKSADMKFWSAWDADEIAGCGALKELDPQHGEVKSMRTAQAYLRQGVASIILMEILGEARRRRYSKLSLETGSAAEFVAAQQLYLRYGFQYCRPFNGYVDDPLSSFMTLDLNAPHSL